MADDERDGVHSSGFGYRWLWVIGAVIALGGVFGLLSRDVLAGVIGLIAGLMTIVLGVVMRRRGALPY